MNVTSITAPALPRLSLEQSPQPQAIAADNPAGSDGNAIHDARITFGEAQAAAIFAARAIHDPRVVGPSETVQSFDRMANVRRGFEHIREIFQPAPQQDEPVAALAEIGNLDPGASLGGAAGQTL